MAGNICPERHRWPVKCRRSNTNRWKSRRSRSMASKVKGEFRNEHRILWNTWTWRNFIFFQEYKRNSSLTFRRIFIKRSIVFFLRLAWILMINLPIDLLIRYTSIKIVINTLTAIFITQKRLFLSDFIYRFGDFFLFLLSSTWSIWYDCSWLNNCKSSNNLCIYPWRGSQTVKSFVNLDSIETMTFSSIAFR